MTHALLVDCDGTLHSKVGVTDPNEHVVDYVKERMTLDPELDLWIWTGFGVAHGAMVAEKLGLDATGFNGKDGIIELREQLSGYETITLLDDDRGLLRMLPEVFEKSDVVLLTIHPDSLRS